MKSRDDLVRRTLSMLGVLAVGQQPSPEDAETVRSQINGKLEELAQRRVIYIPVNTEQFEDAYIEWLAALLAQDLAPDFASQMDAATIQLAENRLRALSATFYVPQPARPEYF